ncbi:MAG: flagellar protein FlgN [Armatimonadetes bacterium]|nr:flagellar protein FlgN [Armatimonadota bacterium]MDW8153989.1 flagellar protein FlgN [Armatimonadota bacterium]
MNDPFETVVGLLDEEIEAHRRLLDLARAEQRALVRGDAEAVGRLVAEQERVVAEIRALERARVQLLELVADREGRSVRELTLAELARLSRPEVARRFEHQRTVLAQLVRELADVNKANALLISSHLQYVRTVVSLLTGAHDGPTSLRVDQRV